MRIALYHNLPPGGALRFVRETTRRSAVVHEYHLYRIVDVDRPAEAADRLEGAAIEVHDVTTRRPLPFLTRYRTPARRATALAALWKAEAEIAVRIDHGGYDVAVVHPCQATQSPSLLRRLRTPTLYYAHEPRRMSYDKPYADSLKWATWPHDRAVEFAFETLLRKADQRAATAAAVLATNSLFTAEALYRIYGRDATVIYAGIDQEVFKPSAIDRGRYVISVGALDVRKGHATVIEALGLMPAPSRPGLKIAFERRFPNYDAELLELAKRRDVHLELCPEVSDAELSVLYSHAQATICAARLEPFGVTPLESLNCGTPVVAINEGGFRESITDGCNGFLVPPTSSGVANGISAVLSGRITRDRDELRSTVAHRTWDQAVAGLHEMLGVTARA